MKFNPNTNIDPKIIQYPLVVDPTNCSRWLPYQIVFDKDENTGVVYKNGPWIFEFETNESIRVSEIRYVVVGLEDDPLDIVLSYNGELIPRVELPN